MVSSGMILCDGAYISVSAPDFPKQPVVQKVENIIYSANQELAVGTTV